MFKIDRKNPLVISVAIIGLLLFLHGLGLLKGVEARLLSALKPLAGSLYEISVSWGLPYRDERGVDELRQELAHLESEVAKLKAEKSAYQETIVENEKLRNALEFKTANNFQVLTARIIAQEEAGEDRRDLVINLGSRDGLRPGLGVVSEEGVIVGKILETKETSSKICLTTSPNCRLAAAVQNQDKTQGLTDGELGLTIKMGYIPQLEKINNGDLIITSGLSGDIPRGLVIGQVIQVKSESNEVWQEATIEPLLNFDNLTIVGVVIP